MAYSLSPNAVLRKGPDGSGILLDAAAGTVLNLNETSASICEILEKGAKDVKNILAVLNETIELPPEAEADIKEFLDLLKARHLLQED